MCALPVRRATCRVRVQVVKLAQSSHDQSGERERGRGRGSGDTNWEQNGVRKQARLDEAANDLKRWREEAGA